MCDSLWLSCLDFPGKVQDVGVGGLSLNGGVGLAIGSETATTAETAKTVTAALLVLYL